MGIAELFTAVLVAGVSCVNAAIPLGVYLRLRDPRFVVLGAANAALATLGAVWTWGQLPISPPGWTSVDEPILALALLVTALFLVATLWPRHA